MDTSDATTAPDAADWAAVASTIHWPSGWHVGTTDETGSTNADLLAAAHAGAPDRTVLAARHQTAGRGRLDRRWEAPPGANLLVSILFRPVPGAPHELTQRVALAAAEAVDLVLGPTAGRGIGTSPRLKWPNDLLLDGRKLAGVLAQMGASGNRIDHAVVGLGLNVGWAPSDAADLGGVVHPLELLREVLMAFDGLPHEPGGLLARYRSRLATLGQRVRVELPGGVVEGRAVDVGADGRLTVIDDCAVSHHIDVGDVVHLRPAP